MKLLRSLSVAAVLSIPAATASAVTFTQDALFTRNGQNFTFNFTDLSPSDGNGGLLTILSGSNNDVYPGLDLNDRREYMDVTVDGDSYGRWECSTANDGGKLIPGSRGGDDCVFSLPLSLSGLNLDRYLSDGILSTTIDFGNRVTYFGRSWGDGDTVIASLSYQVAAVPLPASLPLLIAGLGIIGLSRKLRF